MVQEPYKWVKQGALELPRTRLDSAMCSGLPNRRACHWKFCHSRHWRTAGHLAITFQDSHKIHRLSQLDSITHTSPKGSSSPPCTDFAGSLPVALMRAVQTTFTSQVRNNSPYISEVPYLSTHTPSIHRFQPFDGCNACYIFASEYLQTLDSC
jgi:hypothetical protein